MNLLNPLSLLKDGLSAVTNIANQGLETLEAVEDLASTVTSFDIK